MTIHHSVGDIAGPRGSVAADPLGGWVDLCRGGPVRQGTHRDAVPRRGRTDGGRAGLAPATAANRTQRADQLRLANWKTDRGRIDGVSGAALFLPSPTSMVGGGYATAEFGRPDTVAKRSERATPAGADLPSSSTTDTARGPRR